MLGLRSCCGGAWSFVLLVWQGEVIDFKFEVLVRKV